MNEQKLIEDIRAVFKELIEEEDERFDLTTRRIIYPRNHVYVRKAEELYKKALELEQLNDKYSTYNLKDVMEEEVDQVNRHRYSYKGNVPEKRSVDEIKCRMHKATKHIQMYFYDVLGDIKIE